MKRRRTELINRREERETVRKTVYYSVFSIIIAVLLFTVGIPLLGKFADFLDVVFNKKTDISTPDKAVPQAPLLDNLPEATNSAKIKVSGFSQDGSKVYIYLNGDKKGESSLSDGKFEYDDLDLQDGTNEVAAKAVSSNGKESDFSDVEKVAFSTKEPKLEIDSPADGQSFSGNNRISVTGKTDPDNQVYANGFLANITADGNFQVFVPVPEGDSNIEIKAIDTAGNTKKETRKVHYGK